MTSANEQVDRLQILAAHVEDQLGAAYEELIGLGELAEREADARQVIALHDRIRRADQVLAETDLVLAIAEQRLEELQAIA